MDEKFSASKMCRFPTNGNAIPTPEPEPEPEAKTWARAGDRCWEIRRRGASFQSGSSFRNKSGPGRPSRRSSPGMLKHTHFLKPTMILWRDRVFAIQAKACWLKRCSTNLCANINWWLHLLCPFPLSGFEGQAPSSFILLLGVSSKVSMMFFQMNILGHSMMFHGDYIKRCLLTIRVSHILQLTKLVSEIKNKITAANRLFSTICKLKTNLWELSEVPVKGCSSWDNLC